MIVVVLLFGVGLGAKQLAAYSFSQYVNYASPFTVPLDSSTAGPALAQRVILIVIDGLRVDAFERMRLVDRYRPRASLWRAFTGEPSLSYPGWTTILSGVHRPAGHPRYVCDGDECRGTVRPGPGAIYSAALPGARPDGPRGRWGEPALSGQRAAGRRGTDAPARRRRPQHDHGDHHLRPRAHRPGRARRMGAGGAHRSADVPRRGDRAGGRIRRPPGGHRTDHRRALGAAASGARRRAPADRGAEHPARRIGPAVGSAAGRVLREGLLCGGAGAPLPGVHDTAGRAESRRAAGRSRRPGAAARRVAQPGAGARPGAALPSGPRTGRPSGGLVPPAPPAARSAARAGRDGGVLRRRARALLRPRLLLLAVHHQP